MKNTDFSKETANSHNPCVRQQNPMPSRRPMCDALVSSDGGLIGDWVWYSLYDHSDYEKSTNQRERSSKKDKKLMLFRNVWLEANCQVLLIIWRQSNWSTLLNLRKSWKYQENQNPRNIPGRTWVKWDLGFFRVVKKESEVAGNKYQKICRIK